MDCALATLIACFSWSGFYVDGGLSYQDAGVYRSYERISSERVLADGIVQKTGITDVRWDRHSASNPYGRLAFGFEVRVDRIQWNLEIAHVSSLDDSGDRGVNAVKLGIRWYPLRR